MPLKKTFYTYNGSLPYPPCSTDVTWIIFDNPSSINLDDYIALKTLIQNNIRSETAPLGKRIVFYSTNKKIKEASKPIKIGRKLKCKKITKQVKYISTINDKCKKKSNNSDNFFDKHKKIILKVLEILFYISLFIIALIFSRKVLKSMFSTEQGGSNSGPGLFYPMKWEYCEKYKLSGEKAGILQGEYKLSYFILASFLSLFGSIF